MLVGAVGPTAVGRDNKSYVHPRRCVMVTAVVPLPEATRFELQNPTLLQSWTITGRTDNLGGFIASTAVLSHGGDGKGKMKRQFRSTVHSPG